MNKFRQCITQTQIKNASTHNLALVVLLFVSPCFCSCNVTVDVILESFRLTQSNEIYDTSKFTLCYKYITCLLTHPELSVSFSSIEYQDHMEYGVCNLFPNS